MYYDFTQLVTNTDTLIQVCNNLFKLNIALFSILVCLYVWSVISRCKK